jgi:hypothetical protein
MDMKGTFFKKPLEFSMNIDGESWNQGENISGEFKIIDHSAQNSDFAMMGCHLCFCNIKKFKAKDSKAITVVESILLKPNQSELKFNFNLQDNCPITDNTGSLYIIYGDINSPFESGFLQLNVTPIKPILYFTQIFEQFYRFKLKSFKNKKECIEALVNAPDSREWTSIQKMAIQLKLSKEELDIHFIVNLKKLDFSDNHHKTRDEKREITKTLTKDQYELYGIANQDGIKKVIDEVLNEIKIKPII